MDELPIGFLLTLALVILLCVEALLRLDRAWARPAIGVYLTIAAWYLLDYTTNAAEWGSLSERFPVATVNSAFLQVCWFLIAYRILLEIVALRLAAPNRHIPPTSAAGHWRLFQGLSVAQVFFAIVGLIRTSGDPWNLIYPPAAEPPNYLWGRGGVGEGFDFLVSAAGYTHVAVIAMLGVLVATTGNARLRALAIAVFVLALPPYIFQRARNTMLAVLFPGILAYVLVGRASFITKTVVAIILFLVINFWFQVVITTRDDGGGFREANLIENFEETSREGRKHYGLDMLSELCYISVYLDEGSYQPNWGERYFAELTAVVPRALWPSKPLVGIDYAIARGFTDSRSSHGVNTTVSTGMVGQGVVNFGPVLGPVASAVLMSLWTLILARAWNRRAELPHLFLFMLGLGLTFNMGRDITLLVLFPYVFAACGVYGFAYLGRQNNALKS